MRGSESMRGSERVEKRGTDARVIMGNGDDDCVDGLLDILML